MVRGSDTGYFICTIIEHDDDWKYKKGQMALVIDGSGFSAALFGDDNPNERGRFWWRKQLRKQFEVDVPKPTVIINNIEVERGISEAPPMCCEIYISDVTAVRKVSVHTWSNSVSQLRVMGLGIVHLTPEAAIKMTDAMLAPLVGNVDQSAWVSDTQQTPWPIQDVLAKLIDAADILLDVHNYDGHGYELILEARKVAAKMANELVGKDGE